MRFLEANPGLPRELLFVDDTPDFSAYEAAGFGKIGDVPPSLDKLRPPAGIDAFKYLTTAAAVMPTPTRFGQVPEGVLRLGGTFVVDGERIPFAWTDSIPGDHPAISDVLAAAGAK